MEIPYSIEEREDTGLINSKLGIWIFLASEVMLFGGLFSAYIFLRLAAPPGDFEYWASKLSVPMATVNTMVLISSSVSMVMAWASLKLKDFAKFKMYMGITLPLFALSYFHHIWTLKVKNSSFKMQIEVIDSLPVKPGS